MEVDINKLKKQLMDRIDVKDLVQVEKVERYIDLVNSIRRVSKVIAEEGESVTTVNGSQRFTKAHPLIGERNKINGTLLSIEKSFGFESEPKEDSKNEASDLI